MRPVRVVVINLARRRDRLTAFDRRWRQAAPGVPYERIEAVDRPDAPVIGCWQSHLDALRSGPGPVLVLEDDAVFRDGFTLDLPDPPPGWQLCRLGGALMLGAPAAPGWLRVGVARHTHAYVAADPAALAVRVAAEESRNVGLSLAGALPGHYRLWPGTVGQAAGRSDIDGHLRAADQFWG